MKHTTFIVLSLLLTACTKLPQPTHSNQEVERIETGMGPEDLVLDTLSGSAPRLLISCNDHRLREKAPEGDIYACPLGTNSAKAKVLPRVQEPTDLVFHPHGIHLLRMNDGQTCLFVISHDDKKDEHFVLKYAVLKDSLQFLASYQDSLIHSPNAVVARPDGSFYISNDKKKRGSQVEALFKLKTGNLIHCTAQGNCLKAADRLSYPNGLYIHEADENSRLYAATTRQNRLFAYQIEADGKLLDRQVIGKAKGGDNIRAYQDWLLLPAHLRVFAFVKHFNNPQKPSPSTVYGFHRSSKVRKLLYATDGEQIGAASTAVYYDGYLYIAQVFQPFVLQVKLNDPF